MQATTEGTGPSVGAGALLEDMDISSSSRREQDQGRRSRWVEQGPFSPGNAWQQPSRLPRPPAGLRLQRLAPPLIPSPGKRATSTYRCPRKRCENGGELGHNHILCPSRVDVGRKASWNCSCQLTTQSSGRRLQPAPPVGPLLRAAQCHAAVRWRGSLGTGG